jgi:hypothetical protein
MADAAFSEEDRLRVQQILTPQEWGQLEQGLRGPSDQECMQGLGIAMFTIGQDPVRYDRMMSSFTPGQRELLNVIGDVVQGKIHKIDPNYEVRVREPLTRMRTVLQQDAVAVPGGAPGQRPGAPPVPATDAPPVPPADLDAPPLSADVPRPSTGVPAIDLDAAPVLEDASGPSVSPKDVEPKAEVVPRPPAPSPETSDSVPLSSQQMLDRMKVMQVELEQLRKDGVERDAQSGDGETKVERTPRKKPPPKRSRSRKKKAPSRGRTSKKRTKNE